MKKVLLVLVALVVVLSGVAMVSAYEAHVINVKAKVENALMVTTEQVHYGTVFPEEWLTRQFKVKHSDSFCELTQTRVDTITYEVWVTRKLVEDPPPSPYPAPVEDILGVDYYYWLGDALYIGIFDTFPVDPAKMYPDDADPLGHGVNGTLKHVTTDTAPILSDNISKETTWGFAPDDWYDVIVVGLDVPVFQGSWNDLSDVPIKPSGRNGPTVELTGERNVQGIVLGAEIKIQVTNIFAWPMP